MRIELCALSYAHELCALSMSYAAMTRETPPIDGATGCHLHLPQVAVDTVRVRRGRVDAWVGREAAPRRFEQADANFRLGRDYHSLSLDLTSLVHLRDPETHKCA